MDLRKKLIPLNFFQRNDVLEIGKDLIGKSLFTCFDGELTGGIITETESYMGAEDKACHAYGNRKTKRTRVMFKAGGVAYIYLCYGMHHLFNIVTNKKDIPHAVLIRSIHPTHGLKTILQRRNYKKFSDKITSGPGKVTQALGLCISHNGEPLKKNLIWVEDSGINIPKTKIKCSPRIGVEYAQEHALLPWRFHLEDKLLIA